MTSEPTPEPAITPAPVTAAKPETPPAPATATVAPVAAAPTHVYVLNGIDVFGWAKLRGLSDRLRGSGYDAHYGQWYESRRFERDIRQLQSQQPGAQVAIVGYSFGTYRAKAMANRLTRDGVPVAMVGYIGGDYLRNTASAAPGGARVVNVTGNGFVATGGNLFFNGTDISGANNLRLPARHFDLPKREETFDALLAGLNGSTGATVVVPAPATAAEATPPTPAETYVPQPQPQRSQSGNRPLFRLVSRGER